MSKNKAFANPNVSLTPQIFYILLSLAIKDRHGYDIMKQVAADSQNKLKLGPGTLYGAIKRMIEEKLIISVRSDYKRRKYYRLTQKGRTIFVEELGRYNNAVTLARNRKLFVRPSTVLLNLKYV